MSSFDPNKEYRWADLALCAIEASNMTPEDIIRVDISCDPFALYRIKDMFDIVSPNDFVPPWIFTMVLPGVLYVSNRAPDGDIMLLRIEVPEVESEPPNVNTREFIEQLKEYANNISESAS